MSEYYTVVYKVTGDAKAHAAWWKEIQPLFLDDSPISVTAVSKTDEMTRLDMIREMLEERGGDPCDLLDRVRDLLEVDDPHVPHLPQMETTRERD